LKFFCLVLWKTNKIDEEQHVLPLLEHNTNKILSKKVGLNINYSLNILDDLFSASCWETDAGVRGGC